MNPLVKPVVTVIRSHNLRHPQIDLRESRFTARRSNFDSTARRRLMLSTVRFPVQLKPCRPAHHRGKLVSAEYLAVMAKENSVSLPYPFCKLLLHLQIETIYLDDMHTAYILAMCTLFPSVPQILLTGSDVRQTFQSMGRDAVMRPEAR
jgi:hypothetical protein